LICLREPDDGSGRLFVNDQRIQIWVSVDGGEPTLFVDFNSTFSNFVDNPGFGTGFTGFDFTRNSPPTAYFTKFTTRAPIQPRQTFLFQRVERSSLIGFG